MPVWCEVFPVRRKVRREVVDKKSIFSTEWWGSAEDFARKWIAKNEDPKVVAVIVRSDIPRHAVIRK